MSQYTLAGYDASTHMVNIFYFIFLQNFVAFESFQKFHSLINYAHHCHDRLSILKKNNALLSM